MALLDPLHWNTPIVDREGRPTSEFMRKWEAQRKINESGLPTIADGRVLANISGALTTPAGVALSALLDHVLGNARGQVLYRGAGAWAALDPGAAAQVLTTHGAGADPTWETPAASADKYTPAIAWSQVGNMTVSAGAQATKGQYIKPYRAFIVTSVLAVVQPSATGHTYLAGIYGANSTNLTSRIAQTPAVTIGATGVQTIRLVFNSPVTLAANTLYFIGLSRTDGSGTAVNQVLNTAVSAATQAFVGAPAYVAPLNTATVSVGGNITTATPTGSEAISTFSGGYILALEITG